MDADRQQAIRERHLRCFAPVGSWQSNAQASLRDIPDLLAALAEAEATIGRVEAVLVTAEDYAVDTLSTTIAGRRFGGFVMAPDLRAALDGGRRDGDETGEAGL